MLNLIKKILDWHKNDFRFPTKKKQESDSYEVFIRTKHRIDPNHINLSIDPINGQILIKAGKNMLVTVKDEMFIGKSTVQITNIKQKVENGEFVTIVSFK